MRLLTRGLSSLLALVVLVIVAVPTLVASYRHARDVVRTVGDPIMAPWLPASMVGLLLAALGVIWVRRRDGQPVGAASWGAFGFAMLVIVGANLATVSQGSVLAYAVAIFPPCALAITLELAATIALRRAHRSQGRDQPSTPSIVAPKPELSAGMVGKQHPVTTTHPVHDNAELDDAEHDQKQTRSEDGGSNPAPIGGRDDVPRRQQPLHRPRLRPSHDPGGDDPGIVAEVTRRPEQDNPRGGAPSVHSDAPGKAAVAAAAGVGAEPGDDTARADGAHPTNLVTAPDKPEPRGEPIASPPPSPPTPAASPARPARSSAKSSRAGELATTARTLTATSTPGARTRASTRTRLAREQQPDSR